MIGVEIIGIKDHSRSKLLKERVEQALKKLGIGIPVKEITNLDAIVNADISVTPALRVNGKIILQQILPDLEDLTDLLGTIFEANRNIQQKKIIIPTDFSSTAKNAWQFAHQLSEVLGFSLKAVHVYSSNLVASDFTHAFMDITEWKGMFVDQLSEFVKEGSARALPPQNKMVEYDAVDGLTIPDLVKISEQDDVEMFVMGSTGEDDLGTLLFGSVSTAIARKAKCPTFLIPSGIQFKGFKKILLATDYLNTEPLILEKLMQLATIFESSIHFVHVREEGEKGDYQDVIESTTDLLLQNGTPSFSFQMTTIDATTVREGLNNYIEKENIDLLAMISPKRGFLDNLIHKSVTKEMALYAKIPMLVYHV